MGKHWGDLSTRVHGVVTYVLSPNEQKAFGGMVSRGLPNLMRRIQGQFFRVVPPFVIAYLIYDWGEKKNISTYRKNPKDYEDEH